MHRFTLTFSALVIAMAMAACSSPVKLEDSSNVPVPVALSRMRPPDPKNPLAPPQLVLTSTLVAQATNAPD